jgi:hypothetical protein
MTPKTDLEARLRDLEVSAAPSAMQWLRALLSSNALDRQGFLNAYAVTGRRFADHANAARICLLIHATDRLNADEHAALVRDVFRTGDNRERIALLQSLPLLSAPERFIETAVEACRTHVQDVFEAIACDNPYPVVHFADLNFAQMIMKALFTGAPLSRVQGWQTRVTADLQRMAHDFAAERTAAGRPVPDDVALILGATPVSPRDAGDSR